MRKLTYWVCLCKSDSPAYSIRAKTKKDAEKRRNKSFNYCPAKKVVVEYQDAFDLLCKCLDEGGVE